MGTTHPPFLENFAMNQLSKIEVVTKYIIGKFSNSAKQKGSLLQKIIQNRKWIGGVSLAMYLSVKVYNYRKNAIQRSKALANSDDASVPKKKRLNKQFFRQIIPLLKILIPGWTSKEMFILILHTAFLISRTFLSIYVATLDGAIVRSLVDRNGKKFLFLLCLWFAVAIPATTVNSMIKYMESKLSLAFRTRLSKYAYKIYMTDETYYRVGNLDSRITNADQCLTEDISKFCYQLAHLHSQLSKPLLDVTLITTQLVGAAHRKSKGSGTTSTMLAFIVIFGTAKILQLMQPPFGKLAAQQQQLEGDLRYVHSRLITNSEEISFYRGHKIEEDILNDKYISLVKHMNKIFKVRIFYGILEGFFMKYVWTASGLLMIAIPAFFYDPSKNLVSAEILSDRTQDYVTTKMLLASAAEAIERIMLAFKEINELAGYTARVSEMLQVFDDVQHQKYQKIMVKTGSNSDLTSLESSKMQLSKRGVTIESEVVRFDSVPIVSPNGDILVPNMTFEVSPGMHLLITGPNGCGKSSLFRILGGLWPVNGGTVFKPNIRDMFYIPQRPYLPIGTFRDQVIYPDTPEDMIEKGKIDHDLEAILSWVNLNHILEREGGWGAVNEWKDVLSGGEKQRLGMARLFYHKPRYAILDECTSAVSMDVEGKMYQHAIDLGITLLTVTHRPSLWKYHNHLLQFDGEGHASFSHLNATERMSFKDEKSKLESQLSGVSKMQNRLKELCMLLGEDSVVLDKQEQEENQNTIEG